jgi:predicted glycogen debranching enzyme
VNIVVPRKDCVNPESALRKEWLDTNGLGGYASSTVIDCHTRKYHGLLVAALEKPRGRYVLLSKVDASLVEGNRELQLATNKYPGVFFPTGHMYIDSFEQGLWPSVTYRAGSHLLRRSTLMVHGENTVLVKYELLEGHRLLTLRLRPLIAYRNIHTVIRQNMYLQVRTFFEPNGFKAEPYQGMPPLYVSTSKRSVFYPGPDWFFNLEYLKEQRRGYEYQEDLFCPGVFEVELRKGEEVILAASTEPVKSAASKCRHEVERRKAEYARLAGEKDDHVRDLKFAAGRFFVNEPGARSPGVCAGYHWFGQWGRDTMIALPGLAFACGRMDLGLAVLEGFAQREKNGLLPNFLSEDGAQDGYNSVDAGLWYFWTVQQYLAAGGAVENVKKALYPVMRRVIAAHLNGEVPACRLTEEGFVHAGEADTQLTWMDASVHRHPVTPRNGCPVEVNALWYNALKFWLELTARFHLDDDLAERVGDVLRRLDDSFTHCFWNQSAACLGDVYSENGLDRAVRPNQVFAVSLPFSPLAAEQQAQVVKRVTNDLLTPYGLRTLSPADKAFEPRYEGSQEARDAAYHQGTVWPWLVGHYADAYLKTCRDGRGGRAFLADKLRPLLQAFPDNMCLDSLPEIYNGNPPHTPKGCIAQAWSVGEVIRLHAILRGKQAQ